MRATARTPRMGLSQEAVVASLPSRLPPPARRVAACRIPPTTPPPAAQLR